LIDKLELLLALAKERHFGRAAESCGVTQPTMSTSIKQLEEILGVMLVQRGSRFQGFTPEGERVLDWARRIVGDTRAMRQEINGLKDKLSGEIRIAAIPTVLGMVASLTTPFRARHPEVRFRIVSCTSADVLGLLENLEVDAGLTYIENEPIGKVRTIPLYNETYRLLTAPDGMFGDRDEVTWKEVGQVPLCLLTPDMQNRRRGDADADVELAVGPVHACEDRTLGQCDAGQARGDVGAGGYRPQHSDRRSPGQLQHRPGDPAARSHDAPDRGTGAYRAGSRAEPAVLGGHEFRIDRRLEPFFPDPALSRRRQLCRRAMIARQGHADHRAGAEFRAQLHRAAMQLGQ
jgi:DNA-binding transcriptional LysR family regulator